MVVQFFLIILICLVQSSSEAEKYQAIGLQLFNQENTISMQDDFGKEYVFQIWLKSNNFAIYHYYDQTQEPCCDDTIFTKDIPRKYFVSRKEGAQSTLDASRNSKDSVVYPYQTVLEIINVVHIPWEKRIRGQIKNTLDWVSIKNTHTGYMWLQPMVPKNLIEFQVVRIDATKALNIEFSRLNGLSKGPLLKHNLKYFFKMFENVYKYFPHGLKIKLKDYYSPNHKHNILNSPEKFTYFFKHGETFFEQFNFRYVLKIPDAQRAFQNQMLTKDELNDIRKQYIKINFPEKISDLVKQIELYYAGEEMEQIFNNIFYERFSKRFFERFPIDMVFHSPVPKTRVAEKKETQKLFSKLFLSKSKTTSAPYDDNFV